MRKVTRIFFKTLGVLTILILLLGVSLYFAIQSYSFQTWLGQKASNYLTGELHNNISIKTVKLDFFKKANLEGVYISDKNKDTLFAGDILVDLQKLDYKNQQIEFKKITLKNSTAKLIKYKSDSLLNFQFLIDYFDSGVSDTTQKKKWEIKLGDIYLDNVNFVYRDENSDVSISQNMNFNNLWFTKTYGKLSDIRFDKDTIYTKLNDLRTHEQCGFILDNLTTEAKISGTELLLKKLIIKTPKTYIKGNVNFYYASWDDYSDFINKIKIKSLLEIGTHVATEDIARFTSELNGLKATAYLSGNIEGYVNDINLKDFKFKYGKHTRFDGNLSLTGLPDISTSFLHFDAKELSTNYSDIEQIPNYPFSENKKLELTIEVKRLGTISYKGKFDGFLTDFTTYGKFKTGLGNFATQLSIKIGKKAEDVAYHGKLQTSNFNIGTLFGIKNLNALSINTEIKGKGVSLKTLDADVEGKVLNINYNNYSYKDIQLNGNIKEKIFNGLLTSKDPNADFDFNGSINFKNKIPEIDFISTVNNLDLKKLNFTQQEAKISTQILIILKGNNINDITGTVNFDNTEYTNSEKKFKISTFDLKLEQSTVDKKIVVNSNYFNLTVDGRFMISNLGMAFNQVLNAYYPAFIAKIKTKTIYTDAFKLKLTIKKFNIVNELFLKDLMVSPNSIIGGEFNASTNLMNISLNSESIKYGTIKFNNNVIESYSKNNKINLVFKGSDIQLSDSIKLNNYFMYIVSKDLDTKYNLEWDNKVLPKNTGRIAGKVSFSNKQATLNFDNIFVTAKDSTWKMVTSNPTVIDTGGKIVINPLLFTSNEQSIGVAGSLSNNPSDSLAINTSNVILEQFNPILNAFNLKLEGILHGRLTIHNPETFVFSSDLSFEKLKINNNTLGKMVVKTNYNAAEKTIFTDGYTSLGLPTIDGEEMKNIAFKGHYYLDKKEESIDLDIIASPANLRLLNPLLEGVLTINNALVTGKGKIHGTPDNIKIDGKFKMYNSEIKVDYTNVTYNMTGEIEIMPDQIRFSELLMKEKGLKASPQGTINGNIFHQNFTKIQLDYDISYKNMLILNTTEKQNKTFYGKIYSTGNVGLWGFLNNLHMSVNGTTTRNSKFILPLDGPSEIAESDFIHFVKKDTIVKKIEKTLTGFSLDMAINITQDLNVKIILDNISGDALQVQGDGDLKLKISSLGKFEMVGEYVIAEGDYLFTLENVINKKFEIDAGSTISWSGDPLNAVIDITTSYKQRASVAPLLNDTTGRYKGRFPVDCKLLITDKLFSPNINFAIEFPNLDATAKSRINNVLSDEAELNRQVFSFLLFRTFVTPQIYNTNGGGVTAGGAAASTGSELLSNRMSEFLNAYFENLTGIKDLQVGVNYRAGSQNNQEVDLALSKQFLNNKVTVDGNFGVNNAQSKSSNGLIGDVNIDYKLSEDGRYRVKAFNRSNDNTQITTSGGPYTQGAGFFYREEFETFNDLFTRYLNKIKKKETVKEKDSEPN
ncbi:MAG: translocation/assembly module TamB domain-containing protein [Bacteroidota bacterium]|nr:translocation/assembly module TamB domain-containing protein [Bacteroidota bacterium]